MLIQGFKRKDGTIGIRNHLLVLSTVVCANHAVLKIAEGIKGAVYAIHEHGCGHSNKNDLEQVKRTLIGFAQNPNVGACIIVGLGCEDIELEEIVERIRETGKTAIPLCIQQLGGLTNTINKGILEGRTLIKKLRREERQEVSMEGIILGLECGGSDATSGIVTNPAIGFASDKLIEEGGTSILSETTEHIGAEHLLVKRAVNKEVKKQFLDMINKLIKKAELEQISLTNLAPGNIDGGLTTPEEKSLGCILKGGSSSICEILDYAQKPLNKGLVLMDTPGFDVESVSGMIAGGAQIIVFSTGRGTPVGCPIAPVIKVTGNISTYIKMKEHIDINGSGVIEGKESIEKLGGRIFKEILEVCSGKLTKSEQWGMMDFSITRCGSSY